MKPKNALLVRVALLTVGMLAVGAGCFPKTADTCEVGSEGCDCTTGGACDDGLVCTSQLCVATATPSGAGGSAGQTQPGTCLEPPCEGPSPGSAGNPGTGGAPTGAAGAAAPTTPLFSSFDLALSSGTFWDYRWSTGSSSYGQAGSSSGNTFRVALGDPQTIAGKTGYPVRIIGIAGALAPRWKFLAFEDHVLFGSTDGAKWSTVLDGKTGLVAGGGFFAPLPDVVFRARQTSFSNSIVSGSGILVERSSSSSDTVCVDGLCVHGSAGDSNLTQQEFYFPTFGPGGYHFFFSTTSSSSQSSTWNDVGLVASSLRGDKGLFAEESEPNDSPTTATQSQSAIVGTLGTSQASFTVSQNYYSLGGILIGAATDTLQDCFKLNKTQSPGANIVWDPKSCGGCRLSIVMFDATGKATSSTTALKGKIFDDAQAAGSISLSDYYGSSFFCVGMASPGPVSYVLY